jgi:hypothetical protein
MKALNQCSRSRLRFEIQVLFLISSVLCYCSNIRFFLFPFFPGLLDDPTLRPAGSTCASAGLRLDAVSAVADARIIFSIRKVKESPMLEARTHSHLSPRSRVLEVKA